jgi:hypothetical protein
MYEQVGSCCSCHYLFLSCFVSNCLSFLKPLPAKRPRKEDRFGLDAFADYQKAKELGLLTGESWEHAKRMDAPPRPLSPDPFQNSKTWAEWIKQNEKSVAAAEIVAPLVDTPPPELAVAPEVVANTPPDTAVAPDAADAADVVVTTSAIASPAATVVVNRLPVTAVALPVTAVAPTVAAAVTAVAPTVAAVVPTAAVDTATPRTPSKRKASSASVTSSTPSRQSTRKGKVDKTVCNHGDIAGFETFGHGEQASYFKETWMATQPYFPKKCATCSKKFCYKKRVDCAADEWSAKDCKVRLCCIGANTSRQDCVYALCDECAQVEGVHTPKTRARRPSRKVCP